MKTVLFSVRGMHCKSCEMLLSDGLSGIKGIKKVKVAYKNGTAEVSFDESAANEVKIRQSIRNLGFKVG